MYSVVKRGDREDPFCLAQEGRTGTKEDGLGVSSHLK
jgi:hypothetical protein